MSAVPPAPAPVRKFTPRNTSSAPAPQPNNSGAATTPRPNENSVKPPSSTANSSSQNQNSNSSTISPAMEKKIDDLIRGSIPASKAMTTNENKNPPQAPVAAPPVVIAPQFDKEDVDALRKENKLLQTRVAAFLEFQQQSQNNNQSSSSSSVSSSILDINNLKGMNENEVGALFNLMKSRIKQLELALAWECSRREEAEERCFALMKRAVVSSQ